MTRLCLGLLWSSVALGGCALPDLDLILYGADGCVGRFAASHLAQQNGLKWAIAGRTMARLQEVADTLGKEGGNSSNPAIIVAALDGKTDPKTWVTRARAVVSAAGPFSEHGGEFLVRACAEAGVHYSDTSDEFYWQRWMIDRHNDAAQASGAKLVLSSGFCVLAGDLGSSLAMETLRAAETSSVSVDAWLETYNGGVSAGVINTGKAIKNASYPKEWDSDPYVLAPKADDALRLDDKVEGMKYPQHVHGEGLVVANIFGPYDARLLRRSFTLRGLPVRLRVGASASMYPKWIAFLAAHPGSWGSLSKCPSGSLYSDGSWAYSFKASLSDGTSNALRLSGKGDPGYHFTAWGLAEVGLCLSAKTTGCMKADTSGGVHTPISALDARVLKERLQAVDLIKVESVHDEGSEIWA